VAGKNKPIFARHAFRSGFSLVELAVVIAILSVLGSAAITSYSAALARYRAAAAGQRIVQDLNLAQTVAKTSSAGLTIVFSTTSNNYQLQNYAGPLGGVAQSSYTISLSADPYKATLVSANFGGAAQFTYDRFGQSNSGGFVVVQVGAYISKTITVDANTGRASLQ